MSSATLPKRLSPLVALRVLWGTVLLVAPGVVLGDLPHQRIDHASRVFTRVLGARHLIQAAITSREGPSGWVLGGAAVDATHAATMAAVALLRPDRRKLALTNAATAAALAAAQVAEIRRGRVPHGGAGPTGHR